MSGKIVKSTSVVGGMTLLSRVSGLVRDVVLANLLGDRAAADVFFVAFRIPNFFRRITAEGAFAAAFVPVFTDFRENHGADEGRRFLELTLGRFSLALLLLSLVGVLAAPWLVKAIAWGFTADPEKFALTVTATRLTFPYLFFISLVAMAGAMLNTCGRFAAPAATPVLLNLCLILSALLLIPVTDSGPVALSLGVLLAGVTQLLFQAPFLRRESLLVKPRLRHDTADHTALAGSHQVFRLMLPAIFGASVAQLNVLINTLLASFLVTGSISWLYYSDRLMEFPVGVFGIALGTVILPSLSRQNASNSPERFSETLDWGMRWVFLICVPATAGLVVLAKPLISAIFFHGDFTRDGVGMAAASLVAFSAGLLPIVLVKVLAPGYFARKDTATPVRIGMIAVAVNIAFSVILIGPLQHVGLAAATSIAAVVNAGLLYSGLRRAGVLSPGAGWPSLLLRIAIATLAMGLLLHLCMGESTWWLDEPVLARVLRLAWLVPAAGTLYFILLIVLRVPLKTLLVGRDNE